MKGRCLHRKRGVCPSCRRFEASLLRAIPTVGGKDRGLWTLGVLGRLNRAAREGR